LIYTGYPQAKLTKDFLNIIRMALSHFSDSELEALADLRTGVATKHAFPPGLADITAFISELREKRAAHQESLRRYPPRETEIKKLPPMREPFRPFPKLWEAFADEPDLLDPQKNNLNFNILFDASKALATRGKDAARTILDPRR